MYYAALKTVHLLGIIVWIGGMFFAVHCLRPAAAPLEPPLRVPLLHAALGRFFRVVAVAATLVVASGVAMVGNAAKTTTQGGLRFNMPVDWYLMIGGAVLMLIVFVHVLVLHRQVGRAIDAQAWPIGAQALNGIRRDVVVNLTLGTLIVIATQFGTVS